VGGAEYPGIPMPYSLAALVLPPLRMGGVPVRMVVMTVLALSVLAAAGFERLFGLKGRRRAWPLGLLLLLVLEYFPAPIPASRVSPPPWVPVLNGRPDRDAVLDLYPYTRPSYSMYFQTFHERPLAFGHLARVPLSVAERDTSLQNLIKAGDFDRIRREYRLRYLVIDARRDVQGTVPGALLLYSDAQVKLWDLGTP
jgi:hypothetical protein